MRHVHCIKNIPHPPKEAYVYLCQEEKTGAYYIQIDHKKERKFAGFDEDKAMMRLEEEFYHQCYLTKRAENFNKIIGDDPDVRKP